MLLTGAFYLWIGIMIALGLSSLGYLVSILISENREKVRLNEAWYNQIRKYPPMD